MSAEQAQYSVVYTGKIAPNRKQDEVKRQLAQLFRRDPSQMERLFSGKPCTIKKDVDLELARKYIAAMAKAGAIAQILPPPDRVAAKRPAANEITKAPSKQQPPHRDVILKGFSGVIEPVKITFVYRFWLLAVALVMIVLPIIYCGLTVLSAYGVYYHATENVTLFKDLGSAYLASFVYLTPIVVGGILVLLMFRPFIYMFAKQPVQLPLSKKKEPLLFAFVEKICQLVRAPMPKSIEINNHVNASAGFRNGFVSFFGNDLKLTIGMPLVAGLNTRQFAGVLAHEFGHFSQGAGMRLTYVIRTINYWFATAVYHRGRFDQKIEDWSRSESLYISLIFVIARAFIWVVRQLLWLFMLAGHAISGSMLRQMEFDADRYEARVAGSKIFETTSVNITFFNYAMETLYQDLYTTWENHQYLVDNLSEAIIDKTRQFTNKTQEEIREHIYNSETGIFDTHPCDSERIESAMREDSPGVFVVELPASSLFSNFTSSAKQTTQRHYRDELGLCVVENQLLPLSKIKGSVQNEQLIFEALDKYFRGVFNVFSPLTLPDGDQLGRSKPELLREQWVKFSNAQSLGCANAKLELSHWKKSDERYHEALTALTLMQAGFSIYARDFNLPEADPGFAQTKMSECRSSQCGAIDKLGDYYRNVVGRLTAALNLLFRDDVDLTIKDREHPKSEVKALLPLITRLKNTLPELTVLYEYQVTMGVLFQNMEKAKEQEQRAVELLKQQASGAQEKLGKIYQSLERLDYPFEHARGNITLNQHVFNKNPGELELSEVYNEVTEVGNKLTSLYARCLGQMTYIADLVEKSLGLRIV